MPRPTSRTPMFIASSPNAIPLRVTLYVLRTRKPFSAQQCQWHNVVVLQMRCRDGATASRPRPRGPFRAPRFARQKRPFRRRSSAPRPSSRWRRSCRQRWTSRCDVHDRCLSWSPVALKPSGSAGRCGIRDRSAALRKSIIQTDCARTEGCDLKQATRHHDVLEKVDHLILVGEVAVEGNRRRH